MEFRISRNSSCPCGSENKYKKCCESKITKEQENYYALLQKSSVIKNKLMACMSNVLSDEQMDFYSMIYHGKTIKESFGEEEFAGFFDWLFLLAKDEKEDLKFLEIIIRDFADMFTSLELEILNEYLNNTQVGFFKIVEIYSDEWKVKVREYFTKKEYVIIDRKLSELVIKGDVFLSKIQKIGEGFYFSGTGVLFDRYKILQIEEEIEDVISQLKESGDNSLYEKYMNNNIPTLMNIDFKIPDFNTISGESLKMCIGEYKVDLNYIQEVLHWIDKVDDVFELMDCDFENNGEFIFADASAILREDDLKKYENESLGGIILKQEILYEDGNKFQFDGKINIKKDKFEIWAQSEKRFEFLCDRVDKGIGEYLEFVGEKKVDIDELDLLENDVDVDEKDFDKNETFSKGVTNEYFEKYYINWCDKKIPALGSITPREALKTKEGREKLSDILLDFENTELHHKKNGNEFFEGSKVIREELDFWN